MGRKRNSEVLQVWYRERKVGLLKKNVDSSVTFKYDEEWIENGIAISLSLPLIDKEYVGAEVSSYFDNLLPENDRLRKLIAKKFKAQSDSAYDLLSTIGRDCVGALTFLPLGEELHFEKKLQYAPISESEIANKIQGLKTVTPLGMGEEDDFRLSIAGAQEKMALLKIKGKWFVPHGVTATTHIFKLPMEQLLDGTSFSDSVDNEWISLKICEKLGLPVAKAEIESFENKRVLIVERFDRIWSKDDDGDDILLRLFQEDLCQSLGVPAHLKYQVDGGPSALSIMDFLRASTFSSSDRKKFMTSMLIFDLLAAPDGHAKNFSIFLDPYGFELCPLYDVMSGHFLAKDVNHSNIKLAMSAGDSKHYRLKKIRLRHWYETAVKSRYSSQHMDEIVEGLKEKLEKLNFNNDELPKDLNQNSLSVIVEGMKKRASVLF